RRGRRHRPRRAVPRVRRQPLHDRPDADGRRRRDHAHLTMGPIIDRSVVVTGDGPLADELLDGFDALGIAAVPLQCTFESEDDVRAALAAADARLRGIDQVVHTWLAPGVAEPHRFVELTDDEWADGCERSLAAAWWLARACAE